MSENRIYGMGPYRAEDFSTYTGTSLFVFFHGERVSNILSGLTKHDIRKINSMVAFETSAKRENDKVPRIAKTIDLNGIKFNEDQIKLVSQAISSARFFEAMLYLEERFRKREGRLDVLDRIPKSSPELQRDVGNFSTFNFAQMMTIRTEQKFAPLLAGIPRERGDFSRTVFGVTRRAVANHPGFSIGNGGYPVLDDAGALVPSA
ncbi:MAG: hypothetical protein AAF569_01215, partial [Pseudomonadota bacterium]